MSTSAAVPVIPVRDLSTRWLTDAINDDHGNGRAEVTSFSVEPIGTGQSADSYRVHLEYDSPSPSAPASIVAKFSSEDPSSHQMGRVTGMYEREVYFYSRLSQQLQVRAPHLVRAALDEHTFDFVLLLEDMAPARSVDQLVGCTIDEVSLAVEQAALLHGGSWHQSDLVSAPWLQTGSTSLRMTLDALPEFMTTVRTSFADVIDAEHLDFMADVVPLAASWERFATAPESLWHRDFRVDNLLLDAAGGTVPIAVLDWQTVTMGKGICDLSGLLGGSISIDDRREHERDLVALYRDVMLSTGAAVGSFDQMWHDYRIGALSAVVTVIHAPTRVKRTERGDRMWAAWATSHITQARDLESLSLLQSF